MKVKITNKLNDGTVTKSEYTIQNGNVRIEMGGYTYYIDDSINDDPILVRQPTEDIETENQYDNSEYPTWDKH